MSGLGGVSETRRRGSLGLSLINSKHQSPSTREAPINQASNCRVLLVIGILEVLWRLELGIWSLCFKFCPNRGVIGRFFAFAHFAIDSSAGAFLGQSFTGQNCVDAQSAVFREGKHSVVPPTEKPAFLMMEP